MSIELDIHRFQYLSIICSILFIFFIIESIRRERITEAYSLLWLFMGGLFLFFSIWREGLNVFSTLIGIAYPPAALFVILIVSIILILIQFSIVITNQSKNVRNLTQEIGILKTLLEEKGQKQ